MDFSDGDKIGQTKLRKFSGIKLLKKAVKKSDQKSEWTYVADIRTQIRN